MRKLLIGAAAFSIMAASASVAFACTFHNAGDSKKMTTAEADIEKGDEAMSTFDPDRIKPQEKAKTE